MNGVEYFVPIALGAIIFWCGQRFERSAKNTVLVASGIEGPPAADIFNRPHYIGRLSMITDEAFFAVRDTVKALGEKQAALSKIIDTLVKDNEAQRAMIADLAKLANYAPGPDDNAEDETDGEQAPAKGKGGKNKAA